MASIKWLLRLPYKGLDMRFVKFGSFFRHALFSLYVIPKSRSTSDRFVDGISSTKFCSSIKIRDSSRSTSANLSIFFVKFLKTPLKLLKLSYALLPQQPIFDRPSQK
jgi:hypothetical protein